MAVEEGSAFLPAFFAVPGLIREGSSQAEGFTDFKDFQRIRQAL